MTHTDYVTTGGRKRPRILHVVNALDGGGMERMLLSLVRATAGDRLDHVICTLRGPGPLADSVPASVPLLPLEARGPNHTSGLRLAGILRRHRPGVVHARSWGAWADTAVACALAGRPPLVLSFHGLQSDAGFSRRDRRRARWLQFLCRRYACVSHAGRDQLRRELSVPARRVAVIPNGVDPDRFAPPLPQARAAIRASLGVLPHECVIGTIGSMTPVKDHATLLNAVRVCRGAGAKLRVLLVGDGPLMGELRTQVRRDDLEAFVLFPGRRDDTPDLLGAMDVYVSSSRSEGMSNAVLEAMSVGLAVVATDVGDNARLLKRDRTGAIVPLRDSAALARAIMDLVNKTDQRRQWGTRARQLVLDHYTFGRTVERYLSLYRSLLRPTR
ncbi:MAG: glycosyltransferase [Phycisphaerales bacterium]|nr:MAG: glycosyltransferase [Phycisphaerales bacterium]